MLSKEQYMAITAKSELIMQVDSTARLSLQPRCFLVKNTHITFLHFSSTIIEAHYISKLTKEPGFMESFYKRLDVQQDLYPQLLLHL